MKTFKFFSIHVFRQVLAALSTSLHGICSGIVFGFSSVLLPQLKQDKTIAYDAQYDSWIASITPLSMALGCAIAGPLIDRFGRRISLLVLVLPFVSGWLILGFSSNIQMLLLGRAVSGLCSGALRPMSIVYISEVSDPKIRAMLLISTSLSTNVGVLLSHTVGTFLYWKTAAIVFSIPNILAAVILIYLKESPLWLITKGKSCEGSNVFYWFRAKSEAANNELNAVLNKQSNKSQDLNLKDTLQIVCSKTFMVPFAIGTTSFIQTQFCGVNVLNFYAPDMIRKTFSDSVDNFLIMIIIDSLRVCGTGTVFCSVNHLPRRFIYMLCSIMTTVLIFCLAAYLYFQAANLLWFGLISLMLYIFFAVTLLSTGWSFASEIYPSSVRGLGSAATSSMSFFLLFIAVKITPGIIDAFGMSLFYIFSACITAVCGVILYFVLPETNGKTLQEIEDGLNRDKSKDLRMTSE